MSNARTPPLESRLPEPSSAPMRREPWITSSERAFRDFMIALNRDGGGILFEALSDDEADALMDTCASRAQAHMAKKAA